MRWIILFCILLTSIYAFDDSLIYESKELILEQTIQNTLSLREGPTSQVQWIQSNISFVPQSSQRQFVLDEQFSIQPKVKNAQNIIFEWKGAGEHAFTYTSTIQTKNQYVPITKKVSYPVLEYPQEYQIYLEETDLIDITPQIAQRAKELKSDSDDLYEIAFRIADWVTTEIEYNLSTLTANVSQKASWVYESRSGVCDELSTLYIAMMRSLDIPTRFVSGISYTNSDLFAEKWNAHAWTEVYFPEYGWVPFDLTYRQFGYIDASHIVLKISNDAKEATTLYTWSSKNPDGVTFEVGELKLETIIKESKGKLDDVIQIEATPITPKVGFGSQTYIELVVTNMKNHYVGLTLQVASPESINLPKELSLVLSPFEKEIVYMPVLIPTNLQENYEYTYPISFYYINRELEETSLIANSFEPVVSNQQSLIAQRKLEWASKSVPVDITCDAPDAKRDIVYRFSCKVKPELFGDIKMCAFNTCQKKSVQQEETFLFSTTFFELGEQSVDISLEYENTSKSIQLPILVTDEPKLQMTIAQKKLRSTYANSLFVNITLEKESFANPTQVIIELNDIRWELGTVSADKSLSIQVPASELTQGTNKIRLAYDGNVQEEVLTFEYTNLSWWQHILLFFNVV